MNDMVIFKCILETLMGSFAIKWPSLNNRSILESCDSGNTYTFVGREI